MVSQHLYPAAPLLPPCCQPLPSLAARLDACCLLPNTGVGHCRSTPGQSSSSFDHCATHCLNKQKKVSSLCFNWLNTILAVPWQQLSKMASGNGDGNGQQRWQLQWPTVMETAMADSKGNGNSDGDG